MNTVQVSTRLLSVEVRKITAAGADDRVLEALYDPPKGASGQNIRKFANQTDTEQETAIASFWLFDVVSRYELWAEELPAPNSVRGCQFPSRSYSLNSQGSGFGEIFGSLTSHPDLVAAYASTLSQDALQLSARIDDALLIYRLYKECRNSLAHRGGRAKAVVEAIGNESAVKAADLHVRPDGSQVTLPRFREGERVVISFDQMRCFIALMLRLVFTIDSLLLMSSHGEAEFTRRWVKIRGTGRMNVVRKKLPNWLADTFAQAGIPLPLNPLDIVPYLEASDKLFVRP